MSRPTIPVLRRIASLSEVADAKNPDSCVLFMGHRDKKWGYGKINVDGRTLLVHRVVYEQVRGPIPDGLFVCHRCNVRACCNVEHLYLGTPKENTEYAVKLGRMASGERNGAYTQPHRVRRGAKNGRSKLSEDDVLEIRRLLVVKTSHKEIAKRFGIAPSMVSMISTGRNWSHVK